MPRLSVLAAWAALAATLTGCGQSTPTPTPSAPTPTAPAPAAPASASTPAAPTTVATPSTRPSSGAVGKTARGSYSALVFPPKIGDWTLQKAPQPGDILTTGNYAAADQKTLMSVAVSKGAQGMYDVELSALKDTVPAPDGTYACGDTGVVGAQCVARLSDSLVRLKSFGGSKLTVAQADAVMKQWLAAQK